MKIADLSNTSRNVFNFEDMLCRALKYAKRNGRPPRIVYIEAGGRDYVTWKRFKDMFKRYADYIKTHDRLPRFVTINPTRVSRDVPAGCADVEFYKYHRQQTGYTCGPSSLKMALSSYRIFATEQQIARIAGTTTRGTGHDGMLRAARHWGLRGWFRNFSDTGWRKIYNHIRQGGRIILHVMTRHLRKDCYGNVVWRGDYGHYIFLPRICINDKYCIVADPSKGIRCHTFRQLEAAMRAVYWAPSVLFLAKAAREPLRSEEADKGPGGEIGEQGITEETLREYADICGLDDNEKRLVEELFRRGRMKMPRGDRVRLSRKIDLAYDEKTREVFIDPDVVIARLEEAKEAEETEKPRDKE